MKKRILIIGMSILLIFSLAACGNSDNNQEPNDEPENQEPVEEDNPSEEDESSEQSDQSVNGESQQEIGENLDDNDPMVVVNGEEILKSEFLAEFETTKQMVTAQYGIDIESEENQALIPQLQQQTIQNMISQEALAQEAENQGLEVSEEEIEDSIEQLKEQFGGEEGYDEALAQENLTEEELKDMLRQEQLTTTLIENNVSYDSINVTEEELTNYYEQYKAQMEGQEQEAPAFEEIEEQLKQQLEQQKRQEVDQAYIQEIINESNIEILY